MPTGNEVLDPSVLNLMEQGDYRPENSVDPYLLPVEGYTGSLNELLLDHNGVRVVS